MAEELVDFTARIRGADGREYFPRAFGDIADDGLWEGWIEFIPVAGGPPIRTGRETEQPNRNDLMYWAQGLTTVYLEGALDRAYRDPNKRLIVEQLFGSTVAVLDPFAVYAEGEQTLRSQLAALSRDHLENIVDAYRLAPGDPINPFADLSKPQMIERIIVAVRGRVGA